MIPIPGASFLWKSGAVGASIIAVALLGALILEKQATHRAEQDRDSYKTLADTRLEDLTICRGNRMLLAAGVTRQNAELQTLRDAGEQRRSDSEAEVARLRDANNAAQANLAARMNAPTTGITSCERYQEYDNRLLESLGE